MKAYEFYYRDPIKGLQQIGTLPERRKNLSRITPESIINWGRRVLGKKLDADDIFFVEITASNDTERPSRTAQLPRPLKDL